MKKFLKEFLLRGLIVASGGPVILAIVYSILGATGVVDTLSPSEVSLGIFSITLLAFIVAGMTAIYQLEKIPLPLAILIHGAGLYITYILIYLLNGWLKQQWISIVIFTAVFIVGYALIWLVIYLVNRQKIARINKHLH